MNWLFPLILTLHVLVALAIIGLVLVQHGKGADMGAAFGSGSSGSLFGSSGSANFLSRSTAAMATVFFLTSLGLAYIASHTTKTTGSIMQDAVQSAPVLPVPIPSDDGAANGAKQNAPQEGATVQDSQPASQDKAAGIPQ
ncbi:preprotein translocase subunit SecG [Betaproteobacteria bacterium]|nr:preprotein translocase subunit SecG [Betaproteobacteria bacterium]GHU45321.1 preprotein translocase subunit SecG [Betaproteobacteria bacterium]